MPAAVVVCVIWLGAVVLLGAVATFLTPRFVTRVRWPRLVDRLEAAADSSAAHLGRPVIASVVVLAGWAVTIVVGWVLGLVAHRLEEAVDWPFFRWWESRQLEDWSALWWKLTDVGSPEITQVFTVVGAVTFTVLYRNRRLWWAPSVTMVLGYCAEKYGQEILKLVVDRGHPPTTLGTWPSGGCARVVVVYGLIIFFALYWRGSRDLRLWTAGGSLLVFLLSVQAYARIYNLEHWVTDVVGGAVFGAMLLIVMMAGFLVLARPTADELRARHDEASQRSGHRPVGRPA